MSGAHDEPLGYLLHRVASALRAEVTATALEPVGLSFPQYICMRILSKFPDRSNAELARDTGVSPQAMNMVLRSLEERALVTPPGQRGFRTLTAGEADPRRRGTLDAHRRRGARLPNNG